MDGLNTLENPTISGLKHLTLDQIDTSILNADTIFLENIETSNIIIDNSITLLTGSNIAADSKNISDVELSYLDGVTSNIQTQLNSIDDIVYENQEKLLFQSVNESIDTTYFDGYLVPEFLQIPTWGSILANSKTISDIEISYLDGVTSNIQTQITSNKSNITVLTGRTQNLTAISGESTFIGNLKLQSGGNLLVNSLIISDVELSYLDGVTSNIQTQLVSLQNKTQNLTASAGLTTSLGNISFNPSYGLLVNSKFISDVELSYLDGVTSNIQTQLNSIVSGDLTALQNKTQNQTASSGQTTFSGNVTISQLKYLDDSIQTTAFTSGYITNISDLQDKTANLTRSGTISNFSGSVYVPVLSLGTQINFPDSSTQTTAYIPNTKISMNYIDAANGIWGLGVSLTFNTAYGPLTNYFESSSISDNSVITSGKFTKVGRYMIIFTAKISQLKWYNTLKSQIVIRDQPSGTMAQGRELGPGNQLTAQDYVYYNIQCFCDVATANDTSFAIYSDYYFASSDTSGEVTYLKGEINVYEI
jgi:hypothetical protein